MSLRGSGYRPAVLLLLVLAFAGAASATPTGSDTPGIERPPIEEISEADILAGIEYMNAHDLVLRRYGTAPPFEDRVQWRAWDDRLADVVDAARCDIEPYFYPEGPIHSFGHGAAGYVRIAFIDNRTPDTATMDEIYGLLESRGEVIGIADLPVKFVSSPLFELGILNTSPSSEAARRLANAGFGGIAGPDPFARAATVRTILASYDLLSLPEAISTGIGVRYYG